MHCFTMPHSNPRNQEAPIVKNPRLNALRWALNSFPDFDEKFSSKLFVGINFMVYSAETMMKRFKQDRGERSNDVSMQS